ncbi:hypothetical protein D9615_007934 [Tricholomella constricta]|uniref:DUF202 domain-containing protein n=1 Tax=Tricholomella constricta TaxID=117010 RepID=A0A8H5H1R4_9AGAR|nr:hypothetical protein D9615_007934 [Tricholomella constricta]
MEAYLCPARRSEPSRMVEPRAPANAIAAVSWFCHHGLKLNVVTVSDTMSRRYRGHRANSFKAVDLNELVELRARQRTFYGAYSRTAISNLGSALTVLRLFDRRFYRIGILFAVLGSLLMVLSFLRARHSDHDFSDRWKEEERQQRHQNAIQTVGQEGTRIFGRPFITAGWIVLGVALVVAVVEVVLLVLILQL